MSDNPFFYFQDLQIISFVMSQSELAKKMKEIVECDELHVLCTILSSAKDNTDKKRHEFIGIIKKVVLDLSEEKLGSFLGLLADKLVRCVETLGLSG